MGASGITGKLINHNNIKELNLVKILKTVFISHLLLQINAKLKQNC